MALSGESSTVDLSMKQPSEKTTRKDRGQQRSCNQKHTRQELGTTDRSHSEFHSSLLWDGGSAMDDNTSDNALDIAATLNNVLDSATTETTSVKSPESGSQSAIDSLTQAFTTSKVILRKIAG